MAFDLWVVRWICCWNAGQVTILQRMIVNINYQVILRNNNTLKGTTRAHVGQPIEDLKARLLYQEGIKNHDSFLFNSSAPSHITENPPAIVLTEQGKRSSVKSGVRKMSEDSSSVYEVSSMDYDDEARQFLAVQPEKPPVIRGRVLRCNKVLCCFSSVLYLQLNITELKIYSSSSYGEVREIIQVNDIAQLRSYRKKQYYFIGLIFRNEDAMDLKFTSKNLCKEWMGYLMQAMAFNRYLNERRIFSKADSFRNFINSLNEQEHTRIVTLEDSPHLQTIYEELPQEKVITRQSKKFVKLSEFDIKYKIGSGSFSLIYLAERGGRTYALKQLSKEKLLLRNQMKYAITELKTLIKCRRCKYIVPLYFAFQTPDYLYLALEYIPTGDLSQHIREMGPMAPEVALNILAELVYTIEFLHKQKIIYRDLKPENIMIDGNGHIMLIDFGLAKELDNQEDYAESFLGTPLYLAPERFQGGGSINFKSDVYGVGCIFYEMLHGESPFHSANYHSLVNKIRNDTPDIRKDIPQDFIFFLLGTLEKDPERRMGTMSTHRIFSKINWKNIANKAHKGIPHGFAQKRSSVQLNYKIDQDYDELTFPLKLVNDWDFNYETQ